ncbi:MAG: GNAT family N-acetyltransferase [Acidimicrobiia bacterium]|nr:GNAT family N-acetyltransferase [Acidimicrobiia bacterium]
MEYSLREARPTDKEQLAPWTLHTFAWGDYVVDSFDDWRAHPQSHVLVAADSTDEPVAIARGVMLSGDELWLQGVRVHPDWRRRGIASGLGSALQEWGTAQGAKVAQLMTEDWNEAAREQAIGIGFRQTARWLRAFQPTEHSGRRDVSKVQPAETLRRAGLAEAGPAYLAWSASELSRKARRMMSVNWQWRRLHPADLERAAEHGALFAGTTGWAIAAPRDNYLEVGWIHTTPDRIAEHLTALLAVAGTEKATALEIMAPDVPWLQEAATSGGFELESLLLFEKPL